MQQLSGLGPNGGEEDSDQEVDQSKSHWLRARTCQGIPP
jgi:hypothetical protein